MSIHLSIAARTDVGLQRTNNEDAFVVADVAAASLLRGDAAAARLDVGESGILLAVSDGMGGERAGEVASAVTLESLARSLIHTRPDAPGDIRIKDAVHEANRDVRRAARERGREGMGATLTAVLVQAKPGDATAFVAEVGDSRAYLLRAGRLTRLTKDQSYVQLLLDAGALDESEAAESPLHNVILQAMGHGSSIDVALGRLALRGRDCILLCSDGLTNAVAEDEIGTTIQLSLNLEDACTRLVHLANDRGGPDNITVVAAGVGGDLAAPARGDPSDPGIEVLASFEPRANP